VYGARTDIVSIVMTTKQYLGDGVFVEMEGDMVKLSTEDGDSTANVIFLEPEVFANLELFVRSVENENL
jgi:hypothetical protein